MKFFVTAAIFAVMAVADASNPSPHLRATEGKLTKEDEAYWARFMQDASSMSGGGGGSCDVDVSVDCATVDGNEPCDEIEGTGGLCSGGSCIERLSLSYQNCDCTESNNNQGSAFDCEDTEVVIPEGGEALVFCADAERVYCNCTVSEGGVVVFENPDGCLPDDLTCTISDADSGGVSQTITFDASGGAPLALKDKFGHLTIEACENEDGSSQNCLIDVEYQYTASNTGDVPATITEFERDCNGETKDLIEDLPPNDPTLVIQPGNTFVAREPSTVDACTAGCVDKEVTLVAVAEDGTICEAEDDLEFCIEPPTLPPTPGCDIEPEITCLTSDSEDPCDEIVPPDETCGGECISRLSLSYQDCDCTESDNDQGDNFVCEDFDEQIPEGGEALIFCFDTVRVFCNCTVREGGVIVIGGVDGGCLPDEVTCEVYNNENGEISQNFTFVTTGGTEIPINLKDKFGHTTVESCSDPSGDNFANCLVDVDYSYAFENTGDEEVVLTTFERECDGETRDLIAGIPPDNQALRISPGATFKVEEPSQIDACSTECVDKKLTIETEDEGGESCTTVGEEQFCVDV